MSPIQQMLLGSGAATVDAGSVFFNADENLHVTSAADQVFNFDLNNSFCVEAFIKLDTINRNNYIALRWSDSNLWRFGVNNNNKLIFYTSSDGVESSSTLTTNTWYHVAAVREGTTQGYSNYLRLYVDGVEKASSSGFGSAIESNTVEISIGADEDDLSDSMRGYISDLRITVNEPVYTSTFTPTTEPLTKTSQSVTATNVRLLCCQSKTDVTTAEQVQSGSVAIDNGTPTASTENPFS